jgi:hypothetical protein
MPNCLVHPSFNNRTYAVGGSPFGRAVRYFLLCFVFALVEGKNETQIYGEYHAAAGEKAFAAAPRKSVIKLHGTTNGKARNTGTRQAIRRSSFPSRRQVQDVAHHTLQAIEELRFGEKRIDLLFASPLFERSRAIGGGEDHIRHG